MKFGRQGLLKATRRIYEGGGGMTHWASFGSRHLRCRWAGYFDAPLPTLPLAVLEGRPASAGQGSATCMHVPVFALALGAPGQTNAK